MWGHLWLLQLVRVHVGKHPPVPRAAPATESDATPILRRAGLSSTQLAGSVTLSPCPRVAQGPEQKRHSPTPRLLTETGPVLDRFPAQPPGPPGHHGAVSLQGPSPPCVVSTLLWAKNCVLRPRQPDYRPVSGKPLAKVGDVTV